MALLSITDKEQYFNPRSREGSDCWYYAYDGTRRDFNPRSREGSDVVRSAKS